MRQADQVPLLPVPGLYYIGGFVGAVDEHGGRWVWVGDTDGTPGTRFGMRPVRERADGSRYAPSLADLKREQRGVRR